MNAERTHLPQRPEPSRLDARLMYEYLFRTIVGNDEPEPLGRVEPLHLRARGAAAPSASVIRRSRSRSRPVARSRKLRHPRPRARTRGSFSTRSRLARPSRTVPRARVPRARVPRARAHMNRDPPPRESRVVVVARRSAGRPTARRLSFSVARAKVRCGGGPVDGFRWDACMGSGIGVRGYGERW